MVSEGPLVLPTHIGGGCLDDVFRVFDGSSQKLGRHDT